MPKLFEIKYNDEKRYYEMLIALDSSAGEIWAPAASHWIHYRIPFHAFAALRDMTLYEMLIMEGWTPPEVS